MRQALNFGWDFTPGFTRTYAKTSPKKAVKVDLPHQVVMQDATYLDESAYQGIFTYAKEFEFKGKAQYAYLVFEGVMLQFDLYFNGKSLGHFVSGYVPVKVDVSQYLIVGTNRVVVAVDTNEDPLIPPFGGVVDYLTGGGIYRPVYLETHKDSFCEELFVTATANGELTVHAKLVGNDVPVYLLLDHGKEVGRFGDNEFFFKNPRLYTPEDPYLYELVCQIGKEEKRVSFGFRDATWNEKGFFLNGKKVFLRGLNRHQFYPYTLGAMPDYFQKEDARILKYELGCNVVRTSHYPQSEAFLDECDRIGLLVIDEIPGWQHIGSDPAWRKRCLELTEAMIRKERNHPCLIAYGLRIDESGDDRELYSQVQDVKSFLDPTRASIGVRNFKESECLEDIYGYNDFSCESLEHGADDPDSWTGAKGKAKLITESNGHMFPTATYDPTDRQVEHALRHARVLDDAMGKSGLAGALSWCAFDYPTHDHFGNLDHICHHGVMDQFRGKKPAAYFYESQSDDHPVCYIASSLQSSDYDAALLPPAVIFTNAEEVEVRLGEDRIGIFKPDKEHYPNLPHPPIFVNDWIGERFDEQKISEKDRKTIVEGLNFSAQYGFSKLPFKLKFKMGMLMMKYHYDFTAVYNLYGKYINHWGKVGSDVYTFIAKTKGVVISEQKIAAPRAGHIEARLSKEELHNGDTYDGCYLFLEKKDGNGRRCHKAFDALSIKTEGPIRLLGPNLIHLEGGFTSIAIASLETKRKVKGKVMITGNNYSETLILSID